jgi:hypothetical protein
MDSKKKKMHNSPSQEKRILEHEIEIKEKEYENELKSCCFTMDRRVLVLSFQYVIILVAMSFSMRQLIVLDECTAEPYLALLSSLIGLVIPIPTLR